MKKLMLFWSGGKDSALTYYQLKKSNEFQIVGLISTIDKEFNGIPFHGVKESLLQLQAKMLGLPLQRIYLPPHCSNQEYKTIISEFLTKFKKAGITTYAFGDIHLKDVKEFREEFLHELALDTVFPLWGTDSSKVNELFIETGHRAIVSSIMREKLPLHLLGKEFNQDFINTLPSDIDPAGEYGEFHTFVSFSPYYKMRVPFSKGSTKEIGPYTICKLQDA